MARNAPVGYAYELRGNMMRVSAYKNVDLEEIVLTSLYLRYQRYIYYFNYIKSPKNLLHLFKFSS